MSEQVNRAFRQTCSLQESQRHKAYVTDYSTILFLLSRILAGQCLLDAGLEHSRSNLVFEIHNNVFSECSVPPPSSPTNVQSHVFQSSSLTSINGSVFHISVLN